METTQDRILDLSLRLFRPDWPWPVRYGLAVVFTLAIAGLKLAIPAFGTPGPDLFLTIPVAASAVLAGFGPALLATVGTTLVAAYFTPPVGFDFSLNTSGLDVIGFFFEGLVVAILVLTRLGGWIRAAALAPVVYLAAVEWENSFVAQPAVARWILFGSLLIVLMTIRPQGLLGTPRVEVA